MNPRTRLSSRSSVALLAGLAVLSLGSLAEGQTDYAPPNISDTAPWQSRPTLSPYLLLDEPSPFADADECVALNYYLWVRPQLDAAAARPAPRPYSSRYTTPWRPHPFSPAASPTTFESRGAARFGDHGRYYAFPFVEKQDIDYEAYP